jgi:hypothetical protein
MKKTWQRTVEDLFARKSWKEVKSLPKNQTRWRCCVDVPCCRRPRHRWEDGIRMDLEETGWGEGDAEDSTGSG